MKKEKGSVSEQVLEELNRCVTEVKEEEIRIMAGKFNRKKRIFCDGAGRSRLQAKGFAMRLTQMGFSSTVVGEATTPAITSQDILLILSGSGETPVLVEHAVKARNIGAQILVMTTNRESALGRLSSACIPIHASAKNRESGVSIQPMGSLFEQSVGIICDIMVLFLMERYGISGEQMYQNHSNLE